MFSNGANGRQGQNLCINGTGMEEDWQNAGEQMEDALTKQWVKESLETKEVKKVDEFDCVKNVCVRLLKIKGENSN